MHKGAELAHILSWSTIQQQFPKLQFTLSLKTRTNADRTEGKIHLLSLCCNILGDCLFSNASCTEEQPNLQIHTTFQWLELKYKQTKSECKTQHNSGNVSFGKLLAKLFLKVAHQWQILPKQTSLPVFETPQRKSVVRDDILGSSCFLPACWDLQHPCMDSPSTARSCQTISRMVKKVLWDPKRNGYSSNLVKILLRNSSEALSLHENCCLQEAPCWIRTKD